MKDEEETMEGQNIREEKTSKRTVKSLPLSSIEDLCRHQIIEFKLGMGSIAMKKGSMIFP